MTALSQRIAIIGGGYAGMAAAVTLAAAGRRVCVVEAGPVLGGRARRVEIDGCTLDNGQHLLVGAYRELLGLMNRVGLREAEVMLRLPLDLDVRQGSKRVFRLACPRLPAPLHTLFALLGADGIGWRDRWAAIRAIRSAEHGGWKLAQDHSVADWLAHQRQPLSLIRHLWEPLTLAALNTPIQLASAQVLLHVLRDSLAARRDASDMLLPKVDLSALFPEAAARYIEQGGGQVHTGRMVRQLTRGSDGWRVDQDDTAYTHLVIALPPHRLAMLADGIDALTPAVTQIANWSWQPIYTVYLRYPPDTRLPKPMLGMAGTVTQWLFDRGQLGDEPGLLAAVISAEGPHCDWTQAELAMHVHNEVLSLLPGLPAPSWQRVIAEKRATYACTPGMQRPGNTTTDPSLWLAGDYTAGDYPATLEGAIRSGIAAANGLLRDDAPRLPAQGLA
ncbi:hydroxysqualene dehydroxylase HpnE [Chitinimonas sp. BJYL2]|uniref:hydroxysqualene dehydroxylase HpnE n=1 Tax=Chitinimonas sp. BJYL2 TaxID=2976696 RepID=UPI0022B47E45|nr:hydroxysqualene dehydroxylase HpnE [Chitinimonas sp. BJYL2]